MTNNEPFGPESPDLPGAGDQPAWGSAPTEPPAGSGSDTGPRSGSDTGPRSGSDTGPHVGAGDRPAEQPAGARFFDRLRDLGIVRPDPGQGRLIAGVAAGIARRYGVAPVVVRIGFVLASTVSGLGILLYGLGWMLLPHPDGRIHGQQVLLGTVTAGFVGALLTILAIAHHALPFLLIALVLWMVVRHRRTSRPQTT
jgi:phage shock protein PspC (stress-responsive transcriptional regulator)